MLIQQPVLLAFQLWLCSFLTSSYFCYYVLLNSIILQTFDNSSTKRLRYLKRLRVCHVVNNNKLSSLLSLLFANVLKQNHGLAAADFLNMRVKIFCALCVAAVTAFVTFVVNFFAKLTALAKRLRIS